MRDFRPRSGEQFLPQKASTCHGRGMRASKTDKFGGLPAPLARDFLRHFFSASYAEVWSAPRVPSEYGSEPEVLRRLAGEKLVENIGVERDGDQLWKATSDHQSRARAVNESQTMLFSVKRLRVFGSHLDPQATDLNDVDIALSASRKPHTPADAHEYARASGRNFKTYIDELGWPQREVFLAVKNRSCSLSLTQQNPAGLTDRWRDVFVADGVAPNPFDDDSHQGPDW